MHDDETDRPDDTERLATRLGLPPLEFADVFGAHWHENPGPVHHDYDSDPSGGEGWPVTPWHVSGEPPQLMCRVFEGRLFLARPEGVWSGGTHGLVHQPRDEVHLHVEQLDEARVVVRRLLAARRRSFRYCRYCRRPTPPELRLAEDVCMGCSGWTPGGPVVF